MHTYPIGIIRKEKNNENDVLSHVLYDDEKQNTNALSLRRKAAMFAHLSCIINGEAQDARGILRDSYVLEELWLLREKA